MELPLQISAHNVTLGGPGRALIRRCAAKLETFFDRITACRVIVDVPQRFPAGAPIVYNVRVDVTVPGDEIVVSRQGHPQLESAIQDAFDAVGRRLQDYVNLRHAVPEQPRHEAERGWVVRVFPMEGYGFITTPDSREIYFHRNSVLRGAFDALDVGTPVRFVEEDGDKGPQASTVVVSTRRLQHAKG